MNIEPIYDIGPHTAGVAIHESYSQNFELGGLLDLIESTYRQFQAVCGRISRRLSYSMFLHFNTTVANILILDRCKENGEMRLTSSMLQDILPAGTVLPTAIYEYLTSLLNVLSPGGQYIRFNLPDIAIPQCTLRNEQNEIIATPGTFGIITPQDHNKYECYISLYVTSHRVIASRDQQRDWAPLPQGFFPLGTLPNQNLLGYGPIDELDQVELTCLQDLNFPSTDDVYGRLQFCDKLMNKTVSILMELKDKVAMTKLFSDPTKQQKNYIPQKSTKSNLLFIETTQSQIGARLVSNNGTIKSWGYFESALANQLNLHVTHRRRNEQAPGACYLTSQNNLPVGWLATINNNINMVAPFEPTRSPGEPSLLHEKFYSIAPNGLRQSAVDRYCNLNFKKT